MAPPRPSFDFVPQWLDENGNGCSVIGMQNNSILQLDLGIPYHSSRTASFRTNPREVGRHRLAGERSTGFNPTNDYPAISTTLSRDRHHANSNGVGCKSVKAYCDPGTPPDRQGRCSAGKTLHQTQVLQCCTGEVGRSAMRGLLAMHHGLLEHLFHLSFRSSGDSLMSPSYTSDV